MRIPFALALTCLLPISAQASTPSCQMAPTDFTVFSRANIDYARSDFQGTTGAAGDIRLSNFQIVNTACSGVITGGNFSLTSGAVVHGGVEAGGQVWIRSASVEGTISYGSSISVQGVGHRGTARRITNNVRALPQASAYFVEASRRFTTLPGVTGDSAERIQNGFQLIARGQGVHPFSITAEQLAASSVVQIQAEAGAVVIVNISGATASITGKFIQISGGVQPSGVLFNFTQAQSLTLSTSGSGEFAVVGIPGSVLAPFANTSFTNGLITGGLYVGNLSGDGQVNRAPFAGWNAGQGSGCCPCDCTCPRK